MIYAFEDYVIDTDRHELRHDGIPCPIEPQVLQLLLHLISNRDRVVSKRALLDHIWPEIFVREAALYQRLHQARQAINDSGQTQRIIKTAHGKGYRFLAPVTVLDAAAIEENAPGRPTVEANDIAAKTCFLKALAVSRQQLARSLELRAAISLAKWWKSQDKRQEAYNMLTPIYSWFTEGFNTSDLLDAKLLESDLT